MVMDERIKKFKPNLNFFANWELLAKKPWKEVNLESNIESRLVIYCGLKDEIPGITLEECGRMVDPENGPETWEYVLGEIARAMERGRKNRPAPPATSNGGPSQ